MDKDVAISVKNVTMSFNLNKEKVDNLKEYAIKLLTHKLEYKKFDALKNVSFEVKKGERLAILGFNGAGKSTLLKAIVGVYKPTKGKVETSGVVAPLLELGAGFDPNYSGKENIFLYGAVLGYSREYIQSKFDEIVEFSELGNFINVPIKNYSSGMKARLGFSIATAVNPDVLILDEVLSVGDAKFREKSLKRVQSMFDSGVTVIFVSHSIAQVRNICNKAILLNHGEIIARGDAKDVTELYEKMTKADPNDAKLVDKEIAEFNIAQRKKQLEEEAKRPVYDDIADLFIQPKRRADLPVRPAQRQESTAGTVRRPAHIDIPKRESSYSNSVTSEGFVDVYSSSQKPAVSNPAPIDSPSAPMQRTSQQPYYKTSSIQKNAGANIQSSSSYSSSPKSSAIDRDELEEIIRSFSK